MSLLLIPPIIIAIKELTRGDRCWLKILSSNDNELSDKLYNASWNGWIKLSVMINLFEQSNIRLMFYKTKINEHLILRCRNNYYSIINGENTMHIENQLDINSEGLIRIDSFEKEFWVG